VATSSWQDTIARRIKEGDVVPLLSGSVGNDLVLGGQQWLQQKYAAERLVYPLEDTELSQMAQFKCITDEAMEDTTELKKDYIDFVKNRLFDIAEADGVDQEVRAEVEEEFDDINFTEFCKRLGYPRFDSQQVMPLLELARLPLPIYITSSYHCFLEAALLKAGKKPRSEICRWDGRLDDIESVFEDGEYVPSKGAPLVFHLHGVDTYPKSLVLTVDDHLQFLVAVSREQGRNTDAIPKPIRGAMVSSSLLLLGYSLQSWDFRSLFWALIKPRSTQEFGVAVTVQLEPSEAEKRYLERYLSTTDFKVYWRDIHQYAQELRDLS
jgi:hypothetical protein